MCESINGDLSVRLALASSEMDWSPSPSGSVWRKRLHRVGPLESGQVTSVVRYDANSSFPSHDHPGGEEIVVLAGVFSDEHGDWPAGTYLLNPEGFRHAPFSRDGCELFVKLRQFSGADRRHVAVDAGTIAWSSSGVDGLLVKRLYDQPGYSDSMRLEQWAPALEPGVLRYEQGAEVFVISGQLENEEGTHRPGGWLRFPRGSQQRARTNPGCTLYVKEGGFAYLESASDAGATG